MENFSRRERRKILRERQKQSEKMKYKYRFLKKLLMFLPVVLIIALGSYFIFIRNNKPNVAGESVRSESVWIKGDTNAPNTLEVYSDFQCPACAIYASYLSDLEKDFKDRLKISFRHFPLSSIHKNAYEAAVFAEAAGLQGKFWEMHDKLFDKQSEWANENNVQDQFLRYASELGLDQEKLKTGIKDREVKAEVSADMADARNLRINSTPTFVINGKILDDIVSYEELKEKITNNI